ncbi:hypothetical protein ACFV0B_35900 [Streptomyces xanthophaeus]|uniref:hypothetical protein n=1 Tax=Streptomyces xanthophaeus TaxID=67385 RepID=UPI0036B9FE4B
MTSQENLGGGRGSDVLEAYPETLRARMPPERIRTLVRAVQQTCSLLDGGQGIAAPVQGGGVLPDDLRGEYLLLLAVMITGRLDHCRVEIPVPGRQPGWAVFEAGTGRSPAAVQAAAAEVARRHSERMHLAAELEGIARASGLGAP